VGWIPNVSGPTLVVCPHTSNNPVNSIDPTGHRQSGDCGAQNEDCSGGNLDKQLTDYGVASSGLSDSEKMGAIEAAGLAGYKLYKVYGSKKGYTSPTDALKKVAGSFSISADDSRNDCSTVVSAISCGGSARYMTAFLHEMAHVIDNHSGLMASDLEPYYSQDGKPIDGGNSWVRGSDGFKCVDSLTCMEHPPHFGYADTNCNVGDPQTSKCAKIEQFADLFMNWALDGSGDPNHGFTNDTAGDARRTDMVEQFDWLYKKGYLP
jgi:hypothetical protein